MNRIISKLHRFPGFLFVNLLFFAAEGAYAGGSEAGIQAPAVQENLNMIWVLLSAALVFFMQAGFMCLESGLTEAKNSINVAIKNIADFVLAVTLFWVLGFGIMFGDSLGGLIGSSGFLIGGEDPWRSVFFIFQAVFVGTAATITSGAVAGRIKFGGYLIMSLIASALIYPVFGHWAWGGLLSGNPSGWLEKLGFIDFAGSTVVHSVGGWVALAGVMVVGARRNKFDEEGNPREIQPHSMVTAFLGTFILFLGWFGFNCGSTLAASFDVAGIALNTVLSACWGCVGCSVISWFNSPTKKPQAEMICNGVLGGLVGITAGCAVVSPMGASIIGLVSGAVVYVSINFIEKTVKLDDVVGAVAVHGICGAWGTLAVGIFILPEHLGETTRLWQTGVQLAGIAACFGWTFITAYALFTFAHNIWGLRVSEEHERLGLNVSEHGARSTLLDLTAAMNHVTLTRDYSENLKVEVETGSETGDLSLGFNNMLDAVRESMEKVREQHRLANEAAAEARRALKSAEREKRRAEAASETARNESEKSRFAVRKLASEQERTLEKQRFLEKVLEDAVKLSDSAISGINEIVSAGRGVGTGINDLGEKAEEIIEVVDLISSIADETNLLSLNATIEAARSGGAGKGFNVIAGEIKELSRSTKQASRKVADMIASFQDNFGTLAGHIENQGAMASSNSREINRFSDEFKSIMETAKSEIRDASVVSIQPEPLADNRAVTRSGS